jgi:hypothetical protein
VTRSALLLPLLLIACAKPAQEAKNEASNASAAELPTVIAPARASGDQGVMGATPGPCGSTRVADFAGRIFDEAMIEEMRARSGASRVRVYRPGGPPLPDEGGEGRLLNAYLDESGRIVLLDCS